MVSMPQRPRPLDRQTCEIIAMTGIKFLADDSERLSRFLAVTGIGPAELRSRVQDPALLAAVLEHLLGDESLLLVFAAETGIDPESVAPAQALLSGSGPCAGYDQ